MSNQDVFLVSGWTSKRFSDLEICRLIYSHFEELDELSRVGDDDFGYGVSVELDQLKLSLFDAKDGSHWELFLAESSVVLAMTEITLVEALHLSFNLCPFKNSFYRVKEFELELPYSPLLVGDKWVQSTIRGKMLERHTHACHELGLDRNLDSDRKFPLSEVSRVFGSSPKLEWPFASFKAIRVPKRPDEWFQVISKQVGKYESIHNKTPSGAELWFSFCENEFELSSLNVLQTMGERSLQLAGAEKHLSREAFFKRYKNYYPD